MDLERPDLEGVDPEVVAYIEALEAAVAGAGRRGGVTRTATPEQEPEPEPSEPPTTLNVIVLSRAGVAKRTPRHLYGRQRRGGMGVFDIDLPGDDLPAALVVADEADTLLLLTSEGRGFRLPVAALAQTPVHGRGQPLDLPVPWIPGEHPVALLPADAGSQIAMVSERGQVHRVRASFVGKRMVPGVKFHDPKAGGPLVAACWTGGEDDLFVVTRTGSAIRFPEQRVYDPGSLGIRVGRDDGVVGIAAVNEQSTVFLLSADGRGTLRLMSGFAANKQPGGSGKVAIKTAALAAAVAVQPQDDLFVISRLSKIVRFQVADIPPKEGVVQGVTCMALRADACVAASAGRV
jgi:DNA gyrase subunit A